MAMDLNRKRRHLLRFGAATVGLSLLTRSAAAQTELGLMDLNGQVEFFS